jgi:septal ring factor EnvC (AmiA/AmiB activator)
MPTSSSQRASQALTRIGLVLAPRRRHSDGFVRVLLALLCVALGAAASELRWHQAVEPLRDLALATQDYAQVRRKLEQSQLQLRVGEARGRELELQIDALNARLRESEEQLGFFRSGRARKSP